MKMKASRAGTFVPQPGGYTAFVPEPLPPDPPIQLNDFELLELLSRADRALGRLDGATEILRIRTCLSICMSGRRRFSPRKSKAPKLR